MRQRDTQGRGAGRDGRMRDGGQARPRIRKGSASPPEVPIAGGEPETRPTTGKSETPTHRRKLTVEVVWADITRAEGDVHCVGHYMGVLPQKAELALDYAVSGREDASHRKLLITEWTRRGALRGALGEVAFFPWDPGGVVAVAGMGRLGTFHRPQLKILARSIARSVGLLPHRKTIATVLIGSGPGNLDVAEAVGGLIEGVAEALREDAALEIGKLRIVERYLDRAMEILDVLSNRSQDDRRNRDLALDIKPQLVEENGGHISAEFGCSLLLASLADSDDGLREAGSTSVLDQLLDRLAYEGLPKRVRDKLAELSGRCKDMQGAQRLRRLAMSFRLREDDQNTAQEPMPSRLAFWSAGTDICTAAITDTVTVTERHIPDRLRHVERTVERLTDPPIEQLKKLTTDLYRLLVHSDVKSILGKPDPLVVEVDRNLSRVQWEMLPSTESTYDYIPLGVARPIARQLRTAYSPRPEEPPPRQKLRILVIGDPGDPDLGYSLEHARYEAREVYKLLKGYPSVDAHLLIGAPEDGTGAGPYEGIAAADYFEVVPLLLSGEFDIVHYCGHAEFDPAAPERAGWVFKGGVLTARDLEGMEHPPSLVVANACLTAQLSPAPSPIPVSAARHPVVPSPPRGVGFVASLADEFFRRGISDYIGTAWRVPSMPARMFATLFYKGFLHQKKPLSIGEAVRQAREALFNQRHTFGDAASVWAAYQHYGDPTRLLEFGPQGVLLGR
jgi:CHAT domain